MKRVSDSARVSATAAAQRPLLCRRRWLVVIVVCIHLSIKSNSSQSNRYPFLGRRSAVVSAIARNWNRVSFDWQIAVDYRVCASLIAAGRNLFTPARLTESHYRPLSTSSFVLHTSTCLMNIHSAIIITAWRNYRIVASGRKNNNSRFSTNIRLHLRKHTLQHKMRT